MFLIPDELEVLPLRLPAQYRALQNKKSDLDSARYRGKASVVRSFFLRDKFTKRLNIKQGYLLVGSLMTTDFNGRYSK